MFSLLHSPYVFAIFVSTSLSLLKFTDLIDVAEFLSWLAHGAGRIDRRTRASQVSLELSAREVVSTEPCKLLCEVVCVCKCWEDAWNII